MTLQELNAMKLALEALELLTDTEQTFGALDYGDNAITAIKEALTEHAMRETQRLGQEIEQEPMAWIERDIQCDDFDPDSVIFEKPTIAADGWEWVGLYTTPPQRKPLTHDELSDIWFKQSTDWMEFARAIEAAHGIKEKNT